MRSELIELCFEFTRRVFADEIVEDADIRPGGLKGGRHVCYPERRCGSLFERIGRGNDGDSHGDPPKISLINHLCGVGRANGSTPSSYSPS